MKIRIDGGLFSFEIAEGPPVLPDDPLDCWVDVRADIGPEGQSGGDMFAFSVCTIGRLQKILKKNPSLAIDKTILVEKFDWGVIEAEIEAILKDVDGETWAEIAMKIHRYGDWEFAESEKGVNLLKSNFTIN